MDPSWFSWAGAHGGLVASHLLAAARQGLPAELTARSLTTHFLLPVGDGQLDLTGEVLSRRGGSAAVRVDARQDGGLAATATVQLGADRSGSLAWAPADAVPVRSPADCAVMQLPLELVPFAQHFELRTTDGMLPIAGGVTPRLSAWVRFVDGRLPAEGDLLTLLDVLPPGLYGIAARPVPIPTVELTAHLTGARSDGLWTLVQQETVWAGDGWAVDHSRAWSESGRLLGTATQTRRVLGGATQ